MDAATPLPAAGAGTSRPPKRNFAARVFGYDIFISFALGPAPRGSLSYASDLARRLREQDFTVFFSEDEAPPGEQLDSTLLKALHRARILVVIANRGTLQEPRWIRKEVEEFRRRHPGRPVIPISVDGALLDTALTGAAQEWLAFQDKIWIDESADAAAQGIASAAVIERLATAPSRLRSNVRWSWVVRSVVAVLAVLVAALTFFWKSARDSADQARAELQSAVSIRATVEVPSLLTHDKPGGLERTLQQGLAAHVLAPQTDTYGALLLVLTATPRLLRAVNIGGGINTLEFNPDGSRLYVGGLDGTLSMWDASGLQMLSGPTDAHEGWVWSMAVSGDGSRLVSVGGDWTRRHWDAHTGQPIGPAVESQQPPPCWALGHDGLRTASAGEDASMPNDLAIRQRDAQSAQPLGAPLQGPHGRCTCIAFSPDGLRIVAGEEAGMLRQWDARSGKAIGRPLKAHTGAVARVAYSLDGLRIISRGDDDTWRHWDAQTGVPMDPGFGVAQAEVPEGEQQSTASFSSRDGRREITASPLGKLLLWDAKARGSPQILEDHSRRTVIVKSYGLSATFHPEGARAASGGQDGTLALWNVSSDVSFGSHLPVPRAVSAATVSFKVVAFSHDGLRIAAGDDEGALWLWDAKSGQPAGTPLRSGAEGLDTLAFSPDGTRLVSVDGSGRLRLWDPASGRPVGQPMQEPLATPYRVRFSADSSRLIVNGAEGSLRLWDAGTGLAVGAPIAAFPGSASGAGFSPGGKSLFSVGHDGMLRTWDATSVLSTGKPVLLAGHAGTVTGVTYSPDGSRIAVHYDDGTVRLWDAGSRRSIGGPLGRRSKEALVVTFSPDGARLLTRAGSGTVQVWDAISGKIIAAQRGTNELEPWAVAAFNSDGSLLVFGTEDGSLSLWDTNSGKQIGPKIPTHRAMHAGGVNSVTFSPDGAHIVSAGEDGTVHVSPGPKTWAALLCDKLTRNMSRQQWSEWISPTIEYRLQCPALPVAETRERRRRDFEYRNGNVE